MITFLLSLIIGFSLNLPLADVPIDLNEYGIYKDTQLKVWYVIGENSWKTDLTYQVSAFESKDGNQFLEFLKYNAKDNTVRVIDRITLKPGKFHSEFQYCRFNDQWDSEIYALFSFDQLDTEFLINPIYAIRANRKTEKFESVKISKIKCPNRSE